MLCSIPDHEFGEWLMLPFTRQYFSTEFLALAAIVREFTAFMILGMLAARLTSGGGRGRKITCLLMIAIIAVIFEAGQLLLVARVPDLTATAVSIFGGAAGIWLAEGFVNVFVRTGEEG